MQVVVVGAGIVGLATARAVQRRWPGARVTVLEKEAAVARHQSGRNSGVLHTGLYYAPGSAKAVLAREGRGRLEAWCTEHGVAWHRTGKVVVATSPAELPQLADLEARGRANGVRVERIGPARLAEIEPHAAGLAALHVPDAGVTDYAAVCAELARQVEAHGGVLRFGWQVRAIDDPDAPTAPGAGRAATRRAPSAARRGAVRVVAHGGDVVEADVVVTCAGLHADRLARAAGARTDVRILPFRGEYHHLRTERRHLVRALLYPVPDPAFPFLGVHLTRGIDGEVHAGPNAVPSLGPEAYAWRTSSPAWAARYASRRSTWLLARGAWRTGSREVWRSLSRSATAAALARLVPGIEAVDLVAAPAGVRAQAIDGRGRLLDDFAFAGTARTVCVLNAPSPAATASFAIAEVLADQVASRCGEPSAGGGRAQAPAGPAAV